VPRKPVPKKQAPKKPQKPPERKRKSPGAALPDAADIQAFIANSPGKVGKRDVARAFGIKGAGKLALKALLKSSTPAKSKPHMAQGLPPVLEIEITRIDEHGDAIGQPLNWNEGRSGKTPSLPVIADGKSAPGLGDRVLAKVEAYTGTGDYTHQARLLRLLAKETSRIVGIFRKTSSGGRIITSGKKDRDDVLVQKGDEGSAKDGELVTAELTRHRGRGLPQARVRERLGAADDPRNISLIAIHTHGIPDQMPQAVLDEVKHLAPFSHEHREDLRNIPLITIDPADARDHDDAIWAAPDTNENNKGGHSLIIAIADVAAYVKPTSALDREARKRGNSTYFPDRVVPMLPERISNDLCSLKEGLDRPALACFITIDKDGHKLSHRFSRAIIRVAAGLAYEDAQAAIDGRKPHALLASVLKPLWNAYATLSNARDKRGPLDLDLPERKIVLDKQGHVSKIIVPARLDAHRLVEEFMIQANVAAAEQLNKKRTPLLFRVHEEPSTEKLRALQEFLRTTNIPFALGQVIRAQHFNRILQAAKDTPQHRVVNEVVLRSQSQANYRAENAGHFGLSLANYAHFTSPIRRYADLIVHRALITALKFGDDGLSSQDIKQLDETAELISAAERRSMIAERETIDRMVASHLAENLGATFRGRISGVVGAGLFVVLEETGADGFVPASTLGKDYFAFDPARHALVGAATGETFQLGDSVEVRLMEVAPVKGGLRFEMISDGKPGERPKRMPRPAFRASRKRR
jgi:ribonuclease R